MPKYIFLDNWVLDKYTKKDMIVHLSEFIIKNDFTILITSLLLTEIYNPGWMTEKDPERERGKRVVEFFAQHPCVIVDQQHIFNAETSNYPEILNDIPVELDLNEISVADRRENLLAFLRSDSRFLEQGKDIRQWAKNYENLKSTWLDDAENIKKSAIEAGILHLDKKFNYILSEYNKLMFLIRLDSRLITTSDSDILSENDLKKLVTGKFPAIRIISLCFWYMYIDQDKSNRPAKRKSDIGDFYHMSVIPYCHTFTLDSTMLRLFNRIKNDIKYTCQVVDETELNNQLELSTSKQ